MDNVIQNQITKHLLNGGELSINYHTVTTSKHAFTTRSGLIQINRSLSRLAAVFVTFDQSDRKILVPLDNHVYTGGRREFNNFKYPGDDYSKDDSDYLEFQMQIGSNNFPDMKMNCKAEVFAKLRDACRDLKPLANHEKPVYGLTASGITPK